MRNCFSGTLSSARMRPLPAHDAASYEGDESGRLAQKSRRTPSVGKIGIPATYSISRKSGA